jgi:ribulose-phosphate 3-epimerase
LKESILDEIDMVLLMTVNPGFAGQDFNYSVISKIQELKKIIERRGLRTDIEVDGGINEKTIPLVVRAGANVLVGGSTSIFSGKKDIVTSVKLFRDEAEKWIPKKGN